MNSYPTVDLNKIEITTKYCISDQKRDEQMAYAIKTIKNRIDSGPDRGTDSIAVVCYGPSLHREWENIKNYKYVITCSGAHKFLIEKGIIPNYHVDVDPRRHKIELLGTPHPDVEYLLASVIHPEYVDLIKDYNVKLWHAYHSDSLNTLPLSFPRGEWVFPGGCTVGLRTLLIARFLGFKNMGLFGMDSSFPESNKGEHADFHPNPSKTENIVKVEYQNVVYHTTFAMIEYARQFFKEISMLPDCNIAMHGNGLLQNMAYTNWKDPNGSVIHNEAIIALRAPEVISKDYVKQNEMLHQTNPYYGVSGVKYANDVLSLTKQLNTTDVLDYGCGKGTLASALPFPINEYDPAIKEKSKDPAPADLVVCTDVLEHIEPEYIDNVIGDLARCTLKKALLIIHTGPALKTLPDGRNTHLIQEDQSYWDKKLLSQFTIDSCQNLGNGLRYIVTPKIYTAKTLENVDNTKLNFSFIEIENVKYIQINDNTAWRAQTLRTKEPITIQWLESFNEDDVFVDIGANMGLYSLWAAKNKNTKTYAFEPESQNYALLNQNIFINELSHKVKAYCLSLSDKIGMGDFYLTELMPGSSCHQFDSIVNYKGEPTKFAFEQGSFGVTLDYLVDNNMIAQPTHIKIDVDGLEHRIILGAIKTLSKVKTLLIEVNTNSEEHQTMIKVLNALGFYFNENQVNQSSRKEGPFKGIGEYVFRRS
jgi:FkbM family methyltransferase